MNLELISFLELIFSLSVAACRFCLVMITVVPTKTSGKRRFKCNNYQKSFLKRAGGGGVIVLHCDDNDDNDDDDDEGDDDQG